MTVESILVSVIVTISYLGIWSSNSIHLEHSPLQFHVRSQHSFLVIVLTIFLGDFFATTCHLFSGSAPADDLFGEVVMIITIGSL